MSAPAVAFPGELAVRRLLAAWRIVLAFGFAGAAIGVPVVLLLPSYYTVSAAFQAETPAPSSLGGALSGLASQLGSLPLGGAPNAQLFADLLTTDAVLRRVASGRFPWKHDTLSLDSVFGYETGSAGLRTYKTVKRLRKSVHVDVNVRTGVVRVDLEARTPELALALSESTLAALNAANVDLRQSRAAAEQAFTAERAQAAQAELTAAESALRGFDERNRAIANSPALALEEARLRRSVDMAQQFYLQLRLQQEQAAIQSLRNTPAISVVDPPVLPVKRSWPRRTLGVASALLVGLCLGAARALTRSPRASSPSAPG